MNKIRFTKIREVKSPTRGFKEDAGIDFYMPFSLVSTDIKTSGPVSFDSRDLGSLGTRVHSIVLHPGSRVLIPSGIKVLIEPSNSALIAANKSGISTKKGLVFTAQVVDSTYTGEIHIGLANIGTSAETILAGDKLIQFIHMPLFATEMEEIPSPEYRAFADHWGPRGAGGFGSTGR